MSSDTQPGRFSGYAAVFAVADSGRDLIAPGAFSRTLATRTKPPLLWQHDMTNPIGTIDQISEDNRGLFVSGRFSLGSQRGHDANSLVRDGALNGLSIGYRVTQSKRDTKRNLRILTEIDLVEISVVTFPMQPLARLVAA